MAETGGVGKGFVFNGSTAWLERAEKVIPLGTQTFSKGAPNYPRGRAPFFIERAEGPYLWDVDGNRLLDFVLGLGAITVGYSDPRIDEAIASQLKSGIVTSFSSKLEALLAERLVDLVPCAELVRFGKNGTDVTSAAVRVSRAYTGRDVVLTCGYHGWQDWYIGMTNKGRGVPKAVRSLTRVFPYNDLESLRILVDELAGQVAAIIMEPVQGTPPAEGYLEDVKALAEEHGIVLVFDEIVSGFRVALGGGQEHYGVTPHLGVFGKGCANGMPMSFIAGQREIMKLFAEDVFFSGTFGGETLSLAAALRTIDILETEEAITHFWRIGRRMLTGFEEIIGSEGVSDWISVHGLPPHNGLAIHHPSGQRVLESRALLKQELLRRGVVMGGAHNVCLAHTEKHVDLALDAFGESVRLLREAVAEDRLRSSLEGETLWEGLRVTGS